MAAKSKRPSTKTRRGAAPSSSAISDHGLGIDPRALSEMGWLEGQLPAAVGLNNHQREFADRAKRELIERMFGHITPATTPMALTAHIPVESDIVGIGFGIKEVGENGFLEGEAIRV
jgi:hypothetical protein